MSTPSNAVFDSVRNAYKLLEDYHVRVLDTVRLVRDGLADELQVSWVQLSWGRPWTPKEKNDVLSNPPQGMVLPLCTALYMRLASDDESKPGTFVVEIGHAGREDVGIVKAPRFEVFMKAIPRIAKIKHRHISWIKRAVRFDDEFGKCHWHDGAVHKATLDGIPVVYGGLSVSAIELTSEMAIRDKLTQPLARLIRRAISPNGKRHSGK